MKIEAHVDLTKTEESMKRLSGDVRRYLDMYVKDKEEETASLPPEHKKAWDEEKAKIKTLGEGVDFITKTIPAFMCILEMARDVYIPKKARDLRESAEKLAGVLLPKPSSLLETDILRKMMKEILEIATEQPKKEEEETEEPKIKVVRMSGNLSDLPKELQELFKKFG